MARTKAQAVNDVAVSAYELLVKRTIGRGMAPADALIALEGTVMGVILAIAKEGGEQVVLDTMVQGVRQRLIEARAKVVN